MKTVHFYIHTHWDREWYEPFESYRIRLLSVAKDILAKLASNELPHFYFDGQACVFDDIFELEPQLKVPFETYLRNGRIDAGPWYVLADQALVSGESLIRNLKRGIKVVSQLGPYCPVGYCPDTFGHSADLPKILKGCGIETAVVWRGVPANIKQALFDWVSSDGSKVKTLMLSQGYYQTNFYEHKSIEDKAKQVLELLNDKEAIYCKEITGAIIPIGGDHFYPPTNIAEQVENTSKYLNSHGYECTVDGFRQINELLLQADISEQNRFCGELRDNRAASSRGNAFVLPDVLSARLYLKLANQYTENRIFKEIEPLCAAWQWNRFGEYPSAALEYVEKQLLLNHPHDSICGCSVDSVHEQMIQRYKNIHQVLDAIERQLVLDNQADCMVDLLAQRSDLYDYCTRILLPKRESLSPSSVLIFNSTANILSRPVKISFAIEAEYSKQLWTKLKSQFPDLPSADMGEGDDQFVNKVLTLAGRKLQLIKRSRRDVFFGGGKDSLEPTYKMVDVYDGWFWPGQIAPFSFGLSPADTWTDSKHADAQATIDGSKITNGYLSVSIAASGAIVIEAKKEMYVQTYNLGHSFIDYGDAGDSYNFDPIVGDPGQRSRFLRAELLSPGPLVASIKLYYEIEINAQVRLAEKSTRSPELIKHQIETTLSLHKGLPILFFDTLWQNKAQDHRLEVVFDSGKNIAKTYCQSHFSVIEREHGKEDIVLPVDKGSETIINRFARQNFTIANDQLFMGLGLPEYSVNDASLSITILRAVSMLSRGAMSVRGGGAGPHLPTPGANCLGPCRAVYAWSPLSLSGNNSMQTKDFSDAYNLTEQFMTSIFTQEIPAKVNLPEDFIPGQSLFELDNSRVKIAGFYFDQDSGAYHLRLFNTCNQEEIVNLTMHGLDNDAEVFSADLLGKINREDLVEVASISNPVENQNKEAKRKYRLSFKPFALVTLAIYKRVGRGL